MAYADPANLSTTKATGNQDAAVLYAYAILHVGYAVLHIVMGVDKFFHLLTDWNQYLAPVVTATLRVDAYTFMRGVGIIEVIAGLLVAWKPRIGAYVVAAWLAGIIANLALNPITYWDVALRDFGLMLGALSLGSLSAWAAKRK